MTKRRGVPSRRRSKPVKSKPRSRKSNPRKQKRDPKRRIRAAAKDIQKVITKSEQKGKKKGKKKVNMSKYTKVIPGVEMDAEVPDFHKKPFKPPVVLPSKVKLNLKPISDRDMYKEFPYGD